MATLTDAEALSNIHDEADLLVAQNALNDSKAATEIIFDAAGTPATTGTEGDWRISPSGTGLVAQRYESSVWVTKFTFTA